jgi:hypothetical protein
MRWPFLLLPILAGCGSQEAPAPPPEKKRAVPTSPTPQPQAPSPKAEETETSGDAAETLRRYYARLAAGDWPAAAALRSRGQADAKRLEETFRAYDRHTVQVGQPSRPVEAKGWIYVEVPVMITGSFKGGKPFASAGSVTLRRGIEGSGNPDGWQIYTGD